jgi:hypothetical protein
VSEAQKVVESHFEYLLRALQNLQLTEEKSREVALAITNVEQAELWFKKHVSAYTPKESE